MHMDPSWHLFSPLVKVSPEFKSHHPLHSIPKYPNWNLRDLPVGIKGLRGMRQANVTVVVEGGVFHGGFDDLNLMALSKARRASRAFC